MPINLERPGVGFTAAEREKQVRNLEKIEGALQEASNALPEAQSAKVLAGEAKTQASAAEDKSKNVQTQLNNLVVSGDSSPQAIQASVGADGTEYGGNLKARLDAEHNKTAAQLADITQVFRWQEGTPGSTDGLEAISVVTGFKGNAISPGIRGAYVGQGSRNNENIIGGFLDKVGVFEPNLIDPNSKSAHYASGQGYDNVINSLASVVHSFHTKVHEAATHTTVQGGSYHEVTDGDYNGIVGGTKTFMEYLNGGGYNFAGAGNMNSLFSRFSASIASMHGRIGTAAANKEFSGIYNSYLSTIDGNHAIILAGNECKATKDYSMARGKAAVANNVGESAFSTGKHKTTGDNFESSMHLLRQTTTGIQTQLLLDDNNAIIQPLGVNTSIGIEVSITGFRVDAVGSAKFKISALIERRGSAAPVIRALTVTPEFKSDPLYDADVIISNNAYQIRVKGVSGHTINWSGRLQTEVSRDI
ncbi:hypothetical protein [Planococcus dechangensis]|uniref:Phage tail protein n=1 Tax=Planococcus dechangensis TaxID=1176255 RepID=A0ABV9MAW9_9BACL